MNFVKVSLVLLIIKVEPYWNVNCRYIIAVLLSAFIKVEPYWNVNKVGEISFSYVEVD